MRNVAVFDTNILIDFSYQNEQAARVIKSYPGRLISIVTWIEFLTGVPYPYIEKAKGFLEDMFEIIYPEQAVYEMTVQLRREQRLKLPDAMIYATAKTEGVVLVTRNTNDFDGNQPDVHVPY